MAEFRCVVLDDYQHVARRMAAWSRVEERVEIVVQHDHIAARAALIEALREADIVVAMRERTAFDAALFDALPKLKLLVSTGMRNAAIDMAAAKARGVIVSGTETVGGSTAELAWGLIIALARRIPEENRLVHEGGPWQTTMGTALAGRTLGVLGYGKLGRKMAVIGKAFEMPVIAWSRSLTEDKAEAEGIAHGATVEAVLRAADIVSINLTLTPETRGLIGTEQFAAMRPHAILINTSRGPIVEEAALIEALRQGRIGGAGLDVFDREPLPQDHPLRGMARVVLTPHIGYVVEDNYRAYYRGAVAAIEAWLNGAPRLTLNA